MSLQSLEGRTYGPVSSRITAERVADFVAATGDDPTRWRAAAPPGYAAVILFAVAPLLIDDPDVGDDARVLVHVDQRFIWHGPLAIDLPVTVSGTVTRVRSRGDVCFVGLDVEAAAHGEPLLSSSSTFLMGAGPAAVPGPDRGEPEVTTGSIPEAWASPTRGASRLDLVRYAAASGDFNPIHFDHDAARAAGLDGIVVHGLLMAAWAAQAAAEGNAGSDRTHPLAELTLRFRSSLGPAEVADVERRGSVADEGSEAVDLTLRRGADVLVTAKAVIREGEL